MAQGGGTEGACRDATRARAMVPAKARPREDGCHIKADRGRARTASGSLDKKRAEYKTKWSGRIAGCLRERPQMILLEAALALDAPAMAQQAADDTDSLIVLIASMLLAFIAFVILMRWRF